MISNIPLMCSICLESISDENVCTTNCNHKFCKLCLDLWFDNKHSSCPICRTNIQYFNHKEVSNRVVCIVMKEPLPINPHILGPTVLISRKYFLTINSLAALFLIISCTMGSLWSECKGYNGFSD